MKFEENNKIKFGQDHSFYIGVPAGVDFKVSRFRPLFGGVDMDKFELVAYGYGQLKPWDEKSYGNGSLIVYGLSKKDKEMFENEINRQNKCAYCLKDLNGDFVVLNGGAMVKTSKDSASMGDENLLGFLSIIYHFDSEKKYDSAQIFDNCKNGQFEVYTCSRKCLVDFLNKRIFSLPFHHEKSHSVKEC